MGATPPAAPQSSVRRLACGTVCTVVEYGSVKEIELYHFQPFVRRGRTRPREGAQGPELSTTMETKDTPWVVQAAAVSRYLRCTT